MILAMPFTGVLDPYLQEQTFNSAFELHMHYITFLSNFVYYRPQRSWGKVMFPHMSVILFMGGGWWYPSIHCRWYPSMPCSRSQGVVSQHALQVSRPISRGEVEGIWPGGVSRPTPKGEVEGIWPGGVSRPTPKGEVEGDLARGGLQAHTWWGSIPACTEADPPDGYYCGQYASYWNAFLFQY